MSREKSPPLPQEAPLPRRSHKRPGRSGEGTDALLAQLNEETRVDQLVNRGRPEPPADHTDGR